MSTDKLRRLRPSSRNRPGQSLVEFVLIAPLLLLLFFGLIEFARAWNIRHVITDAAREGARYLAVEHDENKATAAIDNALAVNGLSSDQADIELTQGASGEPSRVIINYPYELGIVRAFLGWALEDAQLNIGTSFSMRTEGSVR